MVQMQQVTYVPGCPRRGGNDGKQDSAERVPELRALNGCGVIRGFSDVFELSGRFDGNTKCHDGRERGEK